MGDKKDTNVTLTVNTAVITQTNKNSAVVFSDDRNDVGEYPGRPDTYVSSVDKDKNITWSGVPSDPNSTDVINITNVSKKTSNGGSDILKDAINTPKSGERTVTAKVKNEDVTGDECYNITFNINGDSSRIFTIDPKLQMTKN